MRAFCHNSFRKKSYGLSNLYQASFRWGKYRYCAKTVTGVPTSDNWLSLKFRAKNVRSERIMESKSRIESSHFIFQSELIHCSFPVKFLNGLRSNVRSLHCINLNFPFFFKDKVGQFYARWRRVKIFFLINLLCSWLIRLNNELFSLLTLESIS